MVRVRSALSAMTVFLVNRARVTQARDGTLWLAITDY
jgi:hypothetical protein